MPRTLSHLNIESPPRPRPGELDAHFSTTREQLAGALAKYVPEESTVVHVDYPIHGNVGDLMLMMATENWFQSNRCEVFGRWHIDNFRFPKLPSGAIIVCQAGGNMGDLYRYQGHREAIVQAYPKHRIVFLPQSIFYQSRERLDHSIEALRRHDDLHLFVRDRRSFEMASAEFTTTSLSLTPDMASFLYPMARAWNGELGRPKRPYEILYIMRRDWEWTDATPLPRRRGIGFPDFLSFVNPFRGRRVASAVLETPDAVCIDWHETAPLSMYQAWATLGLAFSLGRVLPAAAFSRYWQNLARRLVLGGARAVLGCQCLVTNRLHAHFLACLLGTPSVVVDNSYGKCSAYFETWHSELSCTRFFGESNEAMTRLLTANAMA